MSAFAMFSFKSPSLLAFDKIRAEDNLQSIYGLARVPCDTSMRERLDPVNPEHLRPAFKAVFRHLQRGKALEEMVFVEGHYLLALDGTGYFSSKEIHCDSCLEKHHRNGTVTYSHQMLGAVLVHPDKREVLLLMPEPIVKQGGSIRIVATESINLLGQVSGNRVSGISSLSGLGPGKAGALSIFSPILIMENGTLTTGTLGSGQAGNVHVEVGKLILKSNAFIDSSTSGSGQGGRVSIKAADMTIAGESRISSNALNEGQGGTVAVMVMHTVELSGRGSGLFTTTGGDGRGGDLILQAPHIQLSDKATISARSTGSGNARNIRIVEADTLLLTQNSTLTTEAIQASGGNILITAQTMVQLQDSAITAAIVDKQSAQPSELRLHAHDEPSVQLSMLTELKRDCLH